MWPWKIKQQNSTQLRAHHTSPSDDAEQRPNPRWLDITSTYSSIQVECAALDEEKGMRRQEPASDDESAGDAFLRLQLSP